MRLQVPRRNVKVLITLVGLSSGGGVEGDKSVCVTFGQIDGIETSFGNGEPNRRNRGI
jgi:hypothetical protein